jgi:RHS repeat-associated protein
VRKTVTVSGSPTTTLFGYDEGGRLTGEYSGTGAVQAEYIYLDSIPVGVFKGGVLYYIETDHLGTPRQVVKPLGNVVVWKWDFLQNTFGNSAPNQDPDGDSVQFVLGMRFAGQHYDEETSLSYNRFRSYQSTIGRYIESDALGLGGGINTYSYVDADPLEFVDPKGLKKWDPNKWHQSYGYFSSHTNCYGYARDSMQDRDPGDIWFLYLYMTCQRLIDAAVSDGLIPAKDGGDCGGSCPPGNYKVQIFMTSETWQSRDYHFIRQDDDGFWSHKLGRSSYPQREDSEGSVLTCPINQPLNFPPRNYDKYCGTLCAKN